MFFLSCHFPILLPISKGRFRKAKFKRMTKRNLSALQAWSQLREEICIICFAMNFHPESGCIWVLFIFQSWYVLCMICIFMPYHALIISARRIYQFVRLDGNLRCQAYQVEDFWACSSWATRLSSTWHSMPIAKGCLKREANRRPLWDCCHFGDCWQWMPTVIPLARLFRSLP